jgi:hypothetical protein
MIGMVAVSAEDPDAETSAVAETREAKEGHG